MNRRQNFKALSIGLKSKLYLFTYFSRFLYILKKQCLEESCCFVKKTFSFLEIRKQKNSLYCKRSKLFLPNRICSFGRISLKENFFQIPYKKRCQLTLQISLWWHFGAQNLCGTESETSSQKPSVGNKKQGNHISSQAETLCSVLNLKLRISVKVISAFIFLLLYSTWSDSALTSDCHSLSNVSRQHRKA